MTMFFRINKYTTTPIANQAPKYIHVLMVGLPLRRQHAIEIIGKIGTSGTINPRCNFGCVLRRIITDTPTIANVNNAQYSLNSTILSNR